MRTDVKIGIAVGLVLVVGVVVYMVVINSGSSDSPEGDQPVGLHNSPGDGGSGASGGLDSGSPDGSLADSLFPRDPGDLLTPGVGESTTGAGAGGVDTGIGVVGGDSGTGDSGTGDPGTGDSGTGDPGTVTDPEPGSGVITVLPSGPVDPGPADPSWLPADGGSSAGPIDPGSPRTIPYPDPIGASTGGTGAAVTGTVKTHVIKSNDKLWNLAETYYGDGKHWQFLVEANPGLNPTVMTIGRTIRIPPLPTPSTGGGTSGAATLDPVTAAGERIYVVRQGDNGMWGISKSQYGDGKYLPAIAGRNPGVSSSRLKIGQRIILPSLEQAKAFLAGPSGTGTVASGAVTPDPVTATGEKIYVVKQGDNGMWGVSESQYGHGKYFPAIADRNPGVNPSRLKIGRKLILPSLEQAKAFLGGSSASAPASSGGTSVPTPVRAPRPVPPPATAGGDDEPDFS